MPESIFEVPAPEGFVQHGWTCVYHNVACFNPRDCAFVPLFKPTVETRREHLRFWSDMDEQERESVRARAQ